MERKGKDFGYKPFVLLFTACLFIFFLKSYDSTPRPSFNDSPSNMESTGGGTAESRLVAGTPLDINTVTTDELTLLPGIGEALARRIVTRRTEIGGFDSVEELIEVNGIGEEKLASVRPFLKAGPDF
ncbi:MAG: helix-hairpin-helix domain-containing protein [Thermodesulfobacteriota bacterium]